MCWTNGKWDEKLHQETVEGCMQDLSEGKKGRGCVQKEGTRDVLESVNIQQKTTLTSEEAKQRLIEAAQS